MQAMWSNTLDSDVVKGFVALGTEIIKIIDKIGLLNTALIALATISMIKNKMGPIAFLGGISELIRTAVSRVGAFIGSLTGMTAATSAYTAETLAASVANGTLSASEAASIAAKNGLTLATTNLTAAEASEMLMKAGVAKADALAMVAKLGLTASTQALSLANLQAAVDSGILTVAEMEQIASALGLTKANTTLAASFGALWTALWPVLAVIAGVAAIYGIVKLVDHLVVTTEELTEELNELKTELSSLETDIDSLNSELDKTKERMAELIAMPSLSFVEQEELNNLKLTTAELERQLKLKEMLADSKKDSITTVSEKYIDRVWDSEGVDKSYYIDNKGVIHEDDFWNLGTNTKDALDQAMAAYQYENEVYTMATEALANWENLSDYDKYALYTRAESDSYNVKHSLWDEEDTSLYYDQIATKEDVENYIKNANKNMSDIAAGISMVFADENFEGLEYGMSEDIDAFLDELYAYNLKWQQTQGAYVKSAAISSMFDATSTKEMQEFGKALKEIANSDLTDEEKNAEILKQLDGIDGTIDDGVNKIEGKTDAYNRLHLAMETVGVTAQDIADYFVLETGSFDSNTIEGIASQYQHMESVINSLKSMSDGKFTFDGVEYNWEQFFSRDDQGKFKAKAVEFSNILKGMDEKSRETFINIVESAANSAGDLSQIDWDQALSKLDFSGIDRTFELLNNEFEALNNEMFAGAADDINGLIDTVSELQAALEDVAGTMDLVRTAQEQMNSSGRISTKTALELMQTTEDWDQILEITNGTIKLRDGAEQHLIQTELTAIKTQLHYAWTTAQARYETALAAQGELDYANNSGVVMTAESIKAEAIGRVSAVVVALGAAMDKLVAGEWGSVFSAFEDRYKTATATVVQDSQKLTTSVSELKKDADKARKLYEAFESVDSFEEFMENYDFDGDTYEDVLANRWDEIINKYENKLALINNERDRVQAEIDAAEARGGQASKEMYDDLIRLELEEKQLLEDKKEELEAYMAIYGNSLDPETWTEYNNEINATAIAIEEATTNIYEFAQALRDIDMHYFEQANDEIFRLADEIDWVMSLFEDEDMYDEAGNLTEAGVTKINLLRDQMTAYASLAKRWGDELTRLEGMEKGENGLYEFDEDTKNAIAADFQSMFDSGKIDKDTYDAYMKQLNDAWTAGGFSEEVYNDWVNAAEDGMRDAISSQKDVQDKLIGMNEERIDKIEEGINREIEAYEDLIDVQKEELDAARELNDFRKQVANDSKDIQELERRIASLSGSTAAADIAERRKLEAELNQKKSDLNDAYYDHSHDAQSNALDDEAEAFRSAGERYVEYLRERGKDTATVLNDMFLNGIFNADVANDFLLRIQEKYGAPLSVELTEPWALAASQAEAYKSSVNIITGENIPAYVTSLSDTIINQLADGSQKNPWGKAVNAAKTYSDFLSETEFGLPENQLTTFIDELDDIVDKWEAVQTAADNAYDAQERTYNVGGTPGASPGNNNGDGNGGGGDGSGGLPEYSKAVEDLQKILNFFFGAGMYVDGIFGPTTRSWVKEMQKTMGLAASGKYDDKTYKKLMEYIRNRGNVRSWFKENNVVIPGPMSYAKGTTGTTRDEWAITDEPQFGDELVLVPGKDGNLSFMRKGTGVVPADLTANLMEWGQFTPDSLNLGGGVNVNMINNAVNKPEFNFAFDALVKAENITEETLPAVKKLVTQELNRFTKELNYALKGKGAR